MTHVATLLCDPAQPRITDDLVESLTGRINATGWHVLSPGVAVDFTLPGPVEGFETLWRGFQRMNIDFIQQPADKRNKSIILADMDSTMVRQECIDELAAEAGVGDRVAAITARAMNGELDFDAALRERVSLLAGLDVAVIDRVIADRITLMPGAHTFLGTMRAHGAWCALVSGGFTDFTAHVAKVLGFQEHRANTLLRTNGKLTGEPGHPILGRQAKVDALNDICAARGLTPVDVLAIGDGANDLGMLKLAGTGIAAHAKPAVAAQVSVRLNHADLTGALFVQGIPADAHITP